MAARILLATRSEGKLAEMGEIFRVLGVAVTDLRALGIEEAPEENHLEEFATFEENALAKARYFFARSGGVPTIGDDSGLTIDALNGAPGVYTKRWSGRTDISGRELDRVNNEKLVREMRRLEAEQGTVSRSAKYVSVAAYVDGEFEIVRRGEVAGEVLDGSRGSMGFGYDAYFHAPELGGTFAESNLEQTARRSHRGKAMTALVAALRAEGRIG
ncbi:MAG: non-canonical purine NTP pyrophosphatase [Gemmatimonadota bacterium]|nr:non-canonical purine NTP pyrophosphatase [Gemmatimonadota bacterium]